MTFEKLAVMGAGAVGSIIGAYLSRAGRDVTLIDMWPAHVEAMRQHGLTVTAQDEEFTAKVQAHHLADVSALRTQFDAVFLAVKSYDSVWATHFIQPVLKPGGVLVLAQNSINEDWVAPVIGYTRVLGCVVTLGAGLYEPGHVTRTTPSTRPPFSVGELNGMTTPRLEALVQILSAVGPAHATANLWGERWAKLTVNCMANSIAGITQMNNAEMRDRPDVFALFVQVAGEALAIAGRLGVTVEPVNGIPAQAFLEASRGRGVPELHAAWIERGKAVGAGRPSLLQDVMKGRMTEVDYLNGYLVRKGREVGVPTPVNAAIVGIAKRVEAGELKPSPENLRLLAPQG
jgi:2-dehydropantoate 2-reductase